MPAEDESSDESSKEDADYDVPIVVHREEHDDVSDRKLGHVQECSDELLKNAWCEALRLKERCGRLGRWRFARIVGHILEARSSCRRRRRVLQVHAHDVGVILT